MSRVAEIRRRLASVTPEDRDARGRPLLYAYGSRWLLALSGASTRTLERARAGRDLGDPVEAVAWALEQRGHRDLAAQIRAALVPVEEK